MMPPCRSRPLPIRKDVFVATKQATHGTRIEFVDRLRGYRFASDVRGSSGRPEVHVWHTHDTVIVDLPGGGKLSDAKLATLQEESGGFVHPRSTSRTSAPG
jgi:hypothetical protein